MAWIKGAIAGLTLVCVLALAGPANAAMISADVGLNEILIGQSTSINFNLDLTADESASVFEGRLDLIGLNTIASVTLAPGGPTWSSSAGNIVDSQARLSLTSNNQGGSRLVASLGITGLSPGMFEVKLSDPTLIAFDINTPPFLRDVNLANVKDDILASVKVVPLPPAIGLLAPALAALVYNRRRKEQ